jgi:hypothetical protein
MEHHAKLLYRTVTQKPQLHQATHCPLHCTSNQMHRRKDGDIKNESRKGRLWKGTDEDRLFYHNVFLDKWAKHMDKMGYPFSEATLANLRYGVRSKGTSSGMCVPRELAIAILMEVWEARGRYSTADKDLKEYYVEHMVAAQDDTPRSVLVNPKPPPTRDTGSMPRQDHANDAIPTGSDVNQSAPTPKTQNPKVRNIRNVSYRSGEEIHAEDLTWVVMATVNTHTIKEFINHGTISVAPCLDLG